MTVSRMRPHKQPYSLVKSLFHVFAAHFIFKHEVSQNLNIEDHFFVVKRLFKFKTNEGSEIV